MAASSASSAVVNIDVKDFPFSYYLTILQLRIQNNWRPPYQFTDNEQLMTTVVEFQVLKNGTIDNVKLAKSSTRYLYDQAAQRAVYSANPLPPLPEEFGGEYLSVHIEFESRW